MFRQEVLAEDETGETEERRSSEERILSPNNNHRLNNKILYQ